MKNIAKICGVSRVVMVVGYMRDNVKTYLGNECHGIQIEYVDNEIYDKTNNIYSLYLAKDYLIEEDTLLLESDLIFEPCVLTRLLEDNYPNIALVDKYESWMDGTVVTLDEDNHITRFIDKEEFKYEEIKDYYKTVNIYKFKDGSFKDPFISRFVSDGTIKMFAYLLLLNDPLKHPLLCVEEPENYLHPELLNELAEEFREYAQKGGQVFISTHSPDFVNALKVDELFWLHKENGKTTIIKATDCQDVKELYKSGDKLGWLWNQGYLTGSGPKR